LQELSEKYRTPYFQFTDGSTTAREISGILQNNISRRAKAV
jgi:hypothetical protein